MLRIVLGTALLLDIAINIARPIQCSAYCLIHRGNNAKWLSKQPLHQVKRSTTSWMITRNVQIRTRNSGRLLSSYITRNLRWPRLRAAPKMAPGAGTEPTPDTTRETLAEAMQRWRAEYSESAGINAHFTLETSLQISHGSAETTNKRGSK